MGGKAGALSVNMGALCALRKRSMESSNRDGLWTQALAEIVIL
jgi:hypothetical protein